MKCWLENKKAPVTDRGFSLLLGLDYLCSFDGSELDGYKFEAFIASQCEAF
ncbi:MAG: hypothetical protein R2813_02330 [Flavobacteriales bacterium]